MMDNKLSELKRLTPRQIAVYRDRVAISDSDYELIPVHTGDLRAMLAELEAKDKRIAELERSETQLIEARDVAHDAIDAMYEAATGELPEWSNWFVFADAVEEVAQVRAELETKLATLVDINLPARRDDSYDWDGASPSLPVYLWADVPSATARRGLHRRGGRMIGLLADWIEKAVIGLLVIVMVADMALIASMVEWWFKL